jgi:hypothetical protein
MAIEVDTSRPIQRPKERLALVQAIAEAHPSDEAEWVEWKTAVPLDTAEGRFTASRHILGFANREPSSARRFVGGHAFLVIGAEPGNLVGTARRDPAELEDGLVPYLGLEGPVWDAHHVDVGGVEVLLLEVQPPREGDPIHTLRKAFDKWAEGTIFVRHKGKTDPATSVDVSQLTTRAAARLGEGRIAVDLEWTNADYAVEMLDLGDDAVVDSLVESERARLLRPLELLELSMEAGTSKGLASLLKGPRSDLFEENRSQDQYRSEVQDYLIDLRKNAPLIALSTAIKQGNKSMFGLTVSNPTESNLPEVQVVLQFPGGVGAYDPVAVEDLELPTPPRLWDTPPPFTGITTNLGTGVNLNYPYAWQVNPMRFPRIAVRMSDESVKVAFNPVDLRPRASEELASFHIFVTDSFTETEVQTTWEATSTNADGVASGSLTLLISDTPLKFQRLLGK